MENEMNSTKDIATDFIQIHAAITNALHSAMRHAVACEKTGFQTAAERDGYAMFMRCLVALLHVHHRGEDRILLPFLATHRPELSASFMKEQHVAMEAYLDKLTVRIEDMVKEPAAHTSGNAITRVRDTLVKLNALWLVHKNAEERFLAEQVAPRISKKDREMLVAEFQRHEINASKPMSVMGAFMFYNFEPEMRSQFFSDVPWHLKDVFVPYIWRPRWSKMKPFMAYPPS